MAEKRTLYFEAGAREVWLCELDGRLHFYCGGSSILSPTKAGSPPAIREILTTLLGASFLGVGKFVAVLY